MKYLGYAFYYLIISHLPHSRFSIAFNKIRVWYLCRVLKIMEGGEKTYFEHNVFIGGRGKVRFGRSCQINQNAFIEETEIGNYVMIAPNVTIISSSHNHDRLDIPMAAVPPDAALRRCEAAQPRSGPDAASLFPRPTRSSRAS